MSGVSQDGAKNATVNGGVDSPSQPKYITAVGASGGIV
jgi:hypothetical protein